VYSCMEYTFRVCLYYPHLGILLLVLVLYKRRSGFSERYFGAPDNNGMQVQYPVNSRGLFASCRSVVITFYDARGLSCGCYQDSCKYMACAAGLSVVGPGWNINLPLTC
jgi:hypothetical protein